MDGLIDWISLSWLVSLARHLDQELADEHVPDRVEAVVDELMGRGLAKVGSVRGGAFEAWDCSLTEAKGRVRGLMPDGFLEDRTWGYVAWLSNTSGGDEVARTMQHEQQQSES